MEDAEERSENGGRWGGGGCGIDPFDGACSTCDAALFNRVVSLIRVSREEVSTVMKSLQAGEQENKTEKNCFSSDRKHVMIV